MSRLKWEKEKGAYLADVVKMYDELRQWREEHPKAGIDEIAEQIAPRRRELMGQLMKQLAQQQGEGEAIETLACPDCGETMVYKGNPKREVVHAEGEMKLKRAYYFCAHCERGFFPPG